MNIAGIDKSNRVFTNGFTTDHDALLFRSAFFIRSPFVRLIRNVLVGFLDLFLGSPSCRAVLTLSDGFVSDTVQSVEVRGKGDKYKKTAHDGGYNDQYFNPTDINQLLSFAFRIFQELSWRSSSLLP